MVMSLRSSGLANTILQGTVKGGRRQGRQRERWEDNIREWTSLEFGKSQRAVKNSEKCKKKTGSKIICGAPTTLAVMGLMMMMMIGGTHIHFQTVAIKTSKTVTNKKVAQTAFFSILLLIGKEKESHYHSHYHAIHVRLGK